MERTRRRMQPGCRNQGNHQGGYLWMSVIVGRISVRRPFRVLRKEGARNVSDDVKQDSQGRTPRGGGA